MWMGNLQEGITLLSQVNNLWTIIDGIQANLV